MHTATDHIGELVSKAGNLAETKLELWQLKAVKKTAETGSSLFTILIVMILTGTALILLSLGVALWIGKYLDNTAAGFFLTGGFYALAGLVSFFFRKQLIKKPLRDFIIDKIAG